MVPGSAAEEQKKGAHQEVNKGIIGRTHKWHMIGQHGVKEVVQLEWLTSERSTQDSI